MNGLITILRRMSSGPEDAQWLEEQGYCRYCESMVGDDPCKSREEALRLCPCTMREMDARSDLNIAPRTDKTKP